MKTLLNQIIIAMPHMQDQRFNKSVIFICEHNSYGAIGLIINKRIEKDLRLKIIDELNIKIDFKVNDHLPLYFGGPVSTERGVIIHDNHLISNSVKISDNLFMSSHIDSVKMVQSNTKCKYKFMMGYSGWSPGQLESEIENGDWIIQETSADFVFNDSDEQMWELALGSYGVEISNLSAQGGSA